MATRDLLSGPTTYESAANKERNVLEELEYLPKTIQLYQALWDSRETICALTKHHLGLGSRDICLVLPSQEWIRGSFNICIPLKVQSGSLCRKYLLRCPMPYKLAEARYPGTVDEKLSCEVGTYVWMQLHCTDIRIPFLHGFGFTDQRHFTHQDSRPFYIRLARWVMRPLYRLFGRPDLSNYTPNATTHSLPSAYMLFEYIEPSTGQMLSKTWEGGREDLVRRQRLFQGMARLILSLARIPQPRIGSFQFNDDCTVTLTNRPLTCTMVILENEGTPRSIQKGDTYSNTEPFVSDMLTIHDSYLLSNPNAVFDDKDCRGQMAVRTVLRALSHHYIKRERRRGPFLLQLTDFHASNIFVDDEWNITCLMDLEWVCALPAEMLAVPHWLTGRNIEGITDQRFNEFNVVRREFLHALEQEELKQRGAELDRELSLATIMEETWESKGTWFWYCLDSVNAMLFLLEDHIVPRFSSKLTRDVEKVLSKFWREDSEEVVSRKVAEKIQYDAELRRAFEDSS